MEAFLQQETAGDAQLVELCLQGNRNAFAQIVGRYQSVICGLAYSACGDLGRSEDLAQDTFITAWKSLRDLKEPAKLRPWLCGIARHLVSTAHRRLQRTPTALAGPLPPESCSGAATPHEEAISKEEEALMWHALETIPEIYREPMVLFYRENQSIPAVAGALEISEEAVRQRLSRGRVMLTARLAKTVETTLIKSAPGKAFTIGVLAALPAFTMSARAATIGTATAKGGALAKGAGVLGLFNAILGPLFAFLGPYLCYRLEMEDARSAEARGFVRRFFGILVAGMAPFVVAMLLLLLFGKPLVQFSPKLYAGLWIGLSVAYILFVVILTLSLTLRTKRRAHMISGTPVPARAPAFEYRSKWNLLGLPLVHIRLRGGLERGPVKAWFAAGDAALGVLFAFGGVAVAPVSFGGFAIGLLTLGGLAMGLVPFGGFSLGPWATGAFAVGWQASGACAAGWLAADGVIAVAYHFAQGHFVALAAHANDAAAGSFFQGSHFVQSVHAMMRYANWLFLIYLFPLILWWQARKKNQAKRTSAGV